MNLQMANAKRKTAALDDILIWYTQKGKKKEITVHKQQTHTKGEWSEINPRRTS